MKTETSSEVAAIVLCAGKGTRMGATVRNKVCTPCAGVPVVRPRVLETTALGAALLAGLGAGVYSSLEETARGWQKDLEFTPRMDEATRKLNLKGWHKAVERSLNWAKEM